MLNDSGEKNGKRFFNGLRDKFYVEWSEEVVSESVEREYNAKTIYFSFLDLL